MCSGARRPPPPTPSPPILVFRRPQPAALAPRATASSLFFCLSSSSAARVLLPPRPRPAPPTRHLIALGRCHPRLASLPPASAAYASPSRLRPAPPIPPFASPRLASFSLAGAADASPRRLVPGQCHPRHASSPRPHPPQHHHPKQHQQHTRARPSSSLVGVCPGRCFPPVLDPRAAAAGFGAAAWPQPRQRASRRHGGRRAVWPRPRRRRASRRRGPWPSHLSPPASLLRPLPKRRGHGVRGGAATGPWRAWRSGDGAPASLAAPPSHW